MKKIIDIIARIIAVVIVVLVIVVICLNLKPIELSFFVWHADIPLAVLIAVLFLIGAILGLILKKGNISKRAQRVESDINSTISDIKKLTE
ncbi:hypothetical protein BG262_01960 [Floricoccus penangensis]|uniref:Lipopolysaccharide assembly protein A domain-containing protein n=1 Tax=Floricoccus penangensis TaxID=1859475 RepID=A0A9Q5JFZ8_9LACT|nr:LapA family protein [Floricoccus penangensis]OFI46590.1 hypothetical protein BG262_01960 [Floricoccus penangensis]